MKMMMISTMKIAMKLMTIKLKKKKKKILTKYQNTKVQKNFFIMKDYDEILYQEIFIL